MKKAIITIGFIMGLLIIFSILFLNLAPQFGSNPSSKEKKSYARFSNYNNGEFKNREKLIMFTDEMPISSFFKKDSLKYPKKDILPQNIDFIDFNNKSGNIKIAWLGHSSFIINIDGKILLLDPMLGKHAAPLPLPSLKRYNTKLPLSIGELKSIDAVILSHDHYDHLDYWTIKRIKNKVKTFYVPLGLGNHLRDWGVKEESIIELNWDQSRYIDGIEIVCLTARHFSGRGPLNRNSTLWSSWAIKSKYGKIYFSGDSGYGEHFKKIGLEHGPFDLVMLDCGQYNKAWKYSHMFPEQSVKAAQDLKSKYFMPIHWGAFTLSTHPWTDPPEKSIVFAKLVNQKIINPMIGEIIELDKLVESEHKWWDSF